MRKYIDVDELIRKINEHECYSYDPEVSRICELINDAPALDVEPVRHGHWEQDGHHIRCSECGIYFCDTDREGDSFPKEYCPLCGAKMDGEQEHE